MRIESEVEQENQYDNIQSLLTPTYFILFLASYYNPQRIEK